VIEQLVKFFVVFFVVVDPISLIPLFAGLTQGASARFKKKMAGKATMIALGICVLFALVGAKFLDGTRSTTSEREEAKKREDISVFPLAFPFIAGPGALATILLTAGEVGTKPLLFAGFLCVVAVVLIVCWVLMLATPRLMKVLGLTGANVVSRLSGVILAALAVQFIIDGLRGSFS
jgi:multiple antibiotic resistance protein